MLRILSCVTLAAFVGVLPVADQPGDLLKQADQAFAQKTYSRALELYGKAAKAPEFKKSLDRIRLRSGICLARLSRQDEALVVFRQLAREKPGGLTAARGLVEAGVLSLSMPHYYYEKDGKKHRGKWVQGGTYRWTGTEDVKLGLRDLESAGGILESLAAKALEKKERGRGFLGLLALHQRCFLEWAVGIEQKRHENGGLVPKSALVKEDAFGKLESWNERLAYLYDRAIDVQEKAGIRAGRSLAGYLKGMAFRRVLRDLDGVVRQQKFQIRYHPRNREKGVVIALPENWNPIKILQKTLLVSKGLKLADDILFALAKVQQEQGFYVDAAANYRKLEDQHPKSIWVEDAQHQVEQITFPRISVEVGKTQPSGKRVEATLATRNVPEVAVEIFKFPYRWIFENDRVIHDAELQMSDTGRIVKRLRTSPAAGGRVASFSHKTPDRKRHRHQNEKVLLPLLEKGCYLVQASGNGVTYRDLLLVSDLGLIRHVDTEKVVVFVTDVITGKPVPGADVVVRERLWGNWTFGRGWQVRVKRGKTGPDGTWASARSWSDRRGRVQLDIGTWKGSAAALTPNFSYWTPRSASTSTRVHVFSDRPVYRPGDTIKFSAVMREESDQRYTNLPGEQVTVRVRNPKGTYIFDQVMKTDESGALDQAIVLGEEPPLGRYRIQIRQGKRTLGSGSLRVEEYKKPEFEVTVKPPEEQLRLGATAAVSLEGRYYFGAPVAAGKVEYRIFRETFWPRFHRNEPFRYLYGSIPRDVDPSDRGRGRELVTRGTGQLDENGRLRVEWKTDKWAALDPPRDSVFIVQADVTDSSRRTISGAGRIPVTRTAFQANLTADRGFYLRGETVSLEIQTQTAAGVALASKGKFRVYRVSQRKDEKDKVIDVLTQVLEEDASTNEQGTGFHKWTCDEAGRFVLSYQARDSWGEIVRTDIPIWIQAPGFRALDFELKNLSIRTDKRVYQPGETAKVLVTSNYPESSVLVCLTAGYRMLEYRVVELEGKAKAIELPITKTMTPNVFIQAFCTRDGGFYAVHHEILVPPVDRLLDVSLAFDKAEYKPGEKGAVTVSVKDDKGQPVAARVALTTYDSSLLYIQQDQTPDIRKHFYGNRRSRNTSGGASHGFGFQGYLSTDVAWGRYETRGDPPLWWSQNSGLVSKILDGRGFGRIDKLLDDLPAQTSDETVEESEEMDLDGFAPKRNMRRGRRSLGGLAEGSDKAGAPASSRAPMKKELKSKKSRPRDGKWGADAGDDSKSGGEESGEPVVRTDFRDTAVWAPDVLCGADGKARVEIPFPESLTRWHTRALAWTGDTRVGEGAADTVTTKDLLVRLQAPRFFVEGDRIVVSAIVNNRTEKDVECEVSLAVAGDTLSVKDQSKRQVTVRAQADLALDWWTDVVADGTAAVTVKVKSANDGDAMRLSFPVMLWGATKTLTGTDILTDAGQSKLEFELPGERNVNATRLNVTVQPSLAGTMLDALPYLIAYPYGCTEQTTSRFIPAVATSLTLKEMGTSLEAIASQRRALAQAGKLAIREAVLSDRRLNDIVQAGIRKLASMQHGDGGFGWWKADRSSPYLTAYVLSGLLLAKEADCGVPEGMIKRALDFLEKQAPTIDNLNTATFASMVLARGDRPPTEVLEKIYTNRDDLSPYGRALLSSAFAAAGDVKRARIVIDNLSDSAQEDKENGTVHWEGGRRRWMWWNNSIETNAAMLQALLDVNSGHRFVAPLVKWLVTNRKGNRWTNTRDTATCVLALCRYAKVSGELNPDYTLTIALGPTKKTFKVTSANMFAFDNVFELKGDALGTGMNRIEITKAGKGRAYVTARMSFFTKEDEIKGAGHELLVARRYFRIEEKPVTTEQNGRKVTKLVSNRIPLVPGAQVESGTIVEVELEVTAKNDFEYLLFEDMKPAGFEPLQLRSGRSYDRGICSNTEFRDERTAFFVTWLTQGTHKLSYKLRAEIPGTLRALPARGECMYSPEYGGITDSFKIQVTEGKGN